MGPISMMTRPQCCGKTMSPTLTLLCDQPYWYCVGKCRCQGRYLTREEVAIVSWCSRQRLQAFIYRALWIGVVTTGLILAGCGEVPTSEPFRHIDFAPRDGTVIEIEVDAGFKPWYGLHRWSDESGAWVSVWNERVGLIPEMEQNYRWRPYEGDLADYIDPTNGLQCTTKYWGFDGENECLSRRGEDCKCPLSK